MNARRVRLLRRRAAAALGVLLCHSTGALAAPADPSGHASVSSTSRWWSLDCGQHRTGAAAAPSQCLLRVRLRGRIDRSRLLLIEEAIRRRDTSARALGRDVALRVEVDSQGGEVFAGMQIGRLLRREGASLSVGPDASCVSACVLTLMGAAQTKVAAGARIGLHRPSFGGPGPDGAGPTSGPLTLYADEMRISRRIVDDMLDLPADRIRLLGVADLAGYGIAASRDGSSRGAAEALR